MEHKQQKRASSLWMWSFISDAYGKHIRTHTQLHSWDERRGWTNRITVINFNHNTNLNVITALDMIWVSKGRNRQRKNVDDRKKRKKVVFRFDFRTKLVGGISTGFNFSFWFLFFLNPATVSAFFLVPLRHSAWHVNILVFVCFYFILTRVYQWYRRSSFLWPWQMIIVDGDFWA